jgi:hypothetical protein
MGDLATTTSAQVQIDRAMDAARAQATEQFAQATVEEILLAAAEKRLAVLEARRKLVLRTLNVTDVAKLGEKLAKNKFAAEKLHEIFGGSFELLKDSTGKPLVDVQVVTNDPDVGEYRIYTYFGRYTRPDGKSIEQMGSFSTKDAFFAKDTSRENPWKSIDEVNVVDVMVAAQTETYKKAVFRGVGLGDWTEEEAETLRSEAKGHDFGAAGGQGAKEVLIGFGRSKGKKPVELESADLDWCLKAYAENVADPKKAKYRAENQRILEALKAEKERRAQGAAPTAGASTSDPPTPAAVESAGAPTTNGPSQTGEGPTPRGRLLGDVYARLSDVAQGNARHIAGMVRLYTKDHGAEPRANLSQLKDQELEQLALLDETGLTMLFTRATTPKE